MAKEPPATIDFEQTLRMMDVADELRRGRRRVEEHLAETDREKIREHLLRRYREMGHEADPALLDEAIETVLAQRSRFRPPEPGLGLRLAGLWVRRRALARRVGLPLLGVAAVAGAIGLASVGLESFQAGRRAGEHERIARMAGRAELLAQRVRDVAREPAIVERAERHYADAARARDANEPDRVEKAIAALSGIVERLEQDYVLTIVRARKRDAVRHYLIVQALGPDRRPLPMEIRDEETGRVETVTEWGERVEKEIYERVAVDHADNQVIDDDVFGRKKAGFFEPESRYESLGQITRW